MADEATATTSVDAPAPPPASDAHETVQANGEPGAVEEDDSAAATATVNGDGKPEEHSENAEVLATGAAATPSSKDKKRKSTGGASEQKAKKLTKKKSMPTLHLDCKPGEYFWARLKGYPPWPSIVCDEAMLPESLLATRPVSTARPDGSIRDDFKEGGKNAKERTFPIMFLATNEFQWMINTNLTPLDPEECKNPPNSKMAKSLIEAWQIASENHDIEYFKNILSVWQEEEEMIRKQEEEAQAESERAAAEKAAKAEQDEANKSKKKARKSKAADDDTAVESVETPKSSKKRKKDVESEAESAKPKKTPKVTKLNAPKTPSDEASASKKSASKPKKKFVPAPKQEEGSAKPELTEAEKQEQREKAVLYLRHRLQKGFLSRDQAPQDSEMAGMADFFTQLEAYENLEPAIIRTTKIHKVLKAIMKLAAVPKNDEFHFKKRSADMLALWNKSMEGEGDAAPTSTVESQAPEVNGGSKSPVNTDKETEDAKDDVEKEQPKAEDEADEEAEEKKEGESEVAQEATEAASETKSAAAATDETAATTKEGEDADTEMKDVTDGA